MESPRASNASPTNEVRRIDSHNILHAEKGEAALFVFNAPLLK